MKKHVQTLRRLNACGEAVEYAEVFRSLSAAWNACERGDWMLWLIGKTINCAPWTDGRKPLLACALDCAETAKHLWPKKQSKRITNAISVLRGWIEGSQPVEAAQQARMDLAYTAAYAADAADATDAAYAAYATDQATTLKLCADIVRRHYPKPTVKLSRLEIAGAASAAVGGPSYEDWCEAQEAI